MAKRLETILSTECRSRALLGKGNLGLGERRSKDQKASSESPVRKWAFWRRCARYKWDYQEDVLAHARTNGGFGRRALGTQRATEPGWGFGLVLTRQAAICRGAAGGCTIALERRRPLGAVGEQRRSLGRYALREAPVIAASVAKTDCRQAAFRLALEGHCFQMRLSGAYTAKC
eukprot:6173732-Pleurochrysis_carterae.AAC.2